MKHNPDIWMSLASLDRRLAAIEEELKDQSSLIDTTTRGVVYTLKGKKDIESSLAKLQASIRLLLGQMKN